MQESCSGYSFFFLPLPLLVMITFTALSSAAYIQLIAPVLPIRTEEDRALGILAVTLGRNDAVSDASSESTPAQVISGERLAKTAACCNAVEFRQSGVRLSKGWSSASFSDSARPRAKVNRGADRVVPSPPAPKLSGGAGEAPPREHGRQAWISRFPDGACHIIPDLERLITNIKRSIGSCAG